MDRSFSPRAISVLLHQLLDFRVHLLVTKRAQLAVHVSIILFCVNLPELVLEKVAVPLFHSPIHFSSIQLSGLEEVFNDKNVAVRYQLLEGASAQVLALHPMNYNVLVLFIKERFELWSLLLVALVDERVVVLKSSWFVDNWLR